MKFAHELKPGDRVNGHENGWMTVLFIEKNRSRVRVLFEENFCEAIWKLYLPYDKVETL